MKTRERILETARRLFNEHGLHAVSVREIARQLELSPGNLSYHFRTKGDLVSALHEQLHEANTAAVRWPAPEALTVTRLFESVCQVFANDYAYRGLMCEGASVVSCTPESMARDRVLHPKRLARNTGLIVALIDAGVLRPEARDEAESLGWAITFFGRHWPADARLYHRDEDEGTVVRTFVLKTLSLLSGWMTDESSAELATLRAAPRRKRGK